MADERPMPKPKTPDPALPNEAGKLPGQPVGRRIGRGLGRFIPAALVEWFLRRTAPRFNEWVEQAMIEEGLSEAEKRDYRKRLGIARADDYREGS